MPRSRVELLGKLLMEKDMRNSAVSINAPKAPAPETLSTLDRVVVKGLFDRVNYDLDFSRTGCDVSVLIAPNGCGKTTILRWLQFLFRPSNAAIQLFHIPMKSIKCILSNGNSVSLHKRGAQGKTRWTLEVKNETSVKTMTIAKEASSEIVFNDFVKAQHLVKEQAGCCPAILFPENGIDDNFIDELPGSLGELKAKMPEEAFKARFEKLVELVSEPFKITGKTLSMADTGLVIKARDGKEISIKMLSDGERQLLAMYAYALFAVWAVEAVPILLMFDLPERGLHIEVQEDFLDSLIDICRLNLQQAVVATHSPSIVNGHFELYCEHAVTLSK